MALMQVLKSYYNDSQMTDTNSLVNALMEKPEELSPIITHLAGREEKKFPLSFMTEGVGNTKSIDRFEYEYRVKTHEINVRPVVRAGGSAAGGDPSNTTVGGLNQPFTVVFPDKWFIFPYTLVSQSGVLARIMAEPVPVSEGFVCRINLQPAGQPIYSIGITPGLPVPQGSSFVATITPATVPSS